MHILISLSFSRNDNLSGRCVPFKSIAFYLYIIIFSSSRARFEDNYHHVFDDLDFPDDFERNIGNSEEALFWSFDSNFDGVIDGAELFFALAYSKHNSQKTPPTMSEMMSKVEEKLREYDSNNDNIITYEDFVRVGANSLKAL